MAQFIEVTRLKRWKIIKRNDYFLLEGIVYGHYSSYCSDGTNITTSYIDDVKLTDDELVIRTVNTQYHLAYEDISDCWNYKQDCVFFEFVDKFSLEELYEYIQTAVDARNERFNKTMSIIEENLENTMLYIEASDVAPWNCNLAAYKNSSGVCSCVEVAVQDDGRTDVVMLTDTDGECSVGYNVSRQHTMIFYNTLFSAIPDEKLTNPDGTVLGFIKNVGKNTLTIVFSWGKSVKLKPKREIQVVYGMGE